MTQLEPTIPDTPRDNPDYAEVCKEPKMSFHLRPFVPFNLSPVALQAY